MTTQADYWQYPCAGCGADIGEPCRTASGRKALNAHTDRIIQENVAWKRNHPNLLEDAARGGF